MTTSQRFKPEQGLCRFEEKVALSVPPMNHVKMYADRDGTWPQAAHHSLGARVRQPRTRTCNDFTSMFHSIRLKYKLHLNSVGSVIRGQSLPLH